MKSEEKEFKSASKKGGVFKLFLWMFGSVQAIS